MYCHNCGNKLEKDSLFCDKCGKKLPFAKNVRLFFTTAPKDCAAGIHYSCLFIATLCLLFLFYLVIIVLLALGSGNIVMTLSGIILGSFFAFMPLVIFLPMIMWIDRFEPEPPKLIFIAFFGGGIISTLIALFFQMLTNPIIGALFDQKTTDLLSASIMAPLTEEPAKALIVLAIFFIFRYEFDGVLDGIVYGAITGLGFEAYENIIYFSSAFAEQGLGGLIGNFVTRWILSALIHAYFTGSFGIALGLAIAVKGRVSKIIIVFAGLMTAMFLHFCWNFVCTVWGTLLSLLLLDIFFLLPCFLIFVIAAVLALKRESRTIHLMLREEIATGLITDREFARLTSVIKRTQKGYNVLTQHGFKVWKEYRILVHAQTKLAFLKHHQSLQESPDRNLEKKVETQRNFIRGYKNYIESKNLLMVFDS